MREIVWGLPSDTFLDSSYWPNTIKHQTYKSGGIAGGVDRMGKKVLRKLPVPLHNLVPAGQPVGHRLRPCCFRRLPWRCSLDHWGSRLRMEVLAWGLLQIQIKVWLRYISMQLLLYTTTFTLPARHPSAFAWENILALGLAPNASAKCIDTDSNHSYTGPAAVSRAGVLLLAWHVSEYKKHCIVWRAKRTGDAPSCSSYIKLSQLRR